MALNPMDNYEKYIGIQATMSAAAPDAGTISAFLTMDPAVYRGHESRTAKINP
jgi:hypothetical protein